MIAINQKVTALILVGGNTIHAQVQIDYLRHMQIGAAIMESSKRVSPWVAFLGALAAT